MCLFFNNSYFEGVKEVLPIIEKGVVDVYERTNQLQPLRLTTVKNEDQPVSGTTATSTSPSMDIFIF
jgi:hypothetical protein